MSKMADKSADQGTGRSATLTVARVRGIVSRALWVVCLTLALILAAAAFSYALDANDQNGLVKLVRDLADAFDLGVFDLKEPVKSFNDPNSDVKTALFNYGLAAVVYLIVGRFLERLIRA